MTPEFGSSQIDTEEFSIRIQRTNSMLLGSASTPLFALIVFAIVQTLRFGFGTADYVALVVGSLLSIALMFSYGMITLVRSLGRPKRTWMFFAALGGFIPFLFFLYVILFRGLWSFVLLKNGFSGWLILRGAVFVVLGQWATYKFYQLTEFSRAMDQVIKAAEAETPVGAVRDR